MHNPSEMSDEHWRVRRKSMQLLVIQSGINLGPELVTNGDFPTDVASWTIGGTALLTFESAQMRVDRNGGIDVAAGHAQQTVTLVIGKSYRVVVDVNDIVGSGTDIQLMIDSVLVDSTLVKRRLGGVRIAAATSEIVGVRIGVDADGTALVDNISVREIL